MKRTATAANHFHANAGRHRPELAGHRRGRARRSAPDGTVVLQDIRGRFKSDGTFVMLRQVRDRRDPKAVDESTDASDTIEWLLGNVPGHNGRVGKGGDELSGVSDVMGALDPHPAPAAIVPQAPPAAREPAVAGELLGVSSLARVVAGEASLADVGALSWMMLRQMIPCAAMGIFVPEECDDSIRGVYAAGAHATVIRDLRSVPGTGVVGWCAANRRMAMNAEPALDYGHHVADLDPPLLSMVAVPLMHEGSVAAVIALYATAKNAFTEDHGRLLELLAPTLATSLAIVQAEHQAETPAVQPVRRSFSEGGPRRARTADLHVLRRR